MNFLSLYPIQELVMNVAYKQPSDSISFMVSEMEKFRNQSCDSNSVEKTNQPTTESHLVRWDRHQAWM